MNRMLQKLLLVTILLAMAALGTSFELISLAAKQNAPFKTETDRQLVLASDWIQDYVRPLRTNRYKKPRYIEAWGVAAQHATGFKTSASQAISESAQLDREAAAQGIYYMKQVPPELKEDATRLRNIGLVSEAEDISEAAQYASDWVTAAGAQIDNYSAMRAARLKDDAQEFDAAYSNAHSEIIEDYKSIGGDPKDLELSYDGYDLFPEQLTIEQYRSITQ